jgi:hypothetical protein
MSELDEELAAATDALLNEHEATQFSGGNRDLEAVVRQIYLTIAPNQPPGLEFDQRLITRLNSEWDRVYGRPRLLLFDRPLARMAAVAAAVVLILAAVLAMTVPVASGRITGAARPLNVVIAVAVLALFMGLVIAIVRSRH